MSSTIPEDAAARVVKRTKPEEKSWTIPDCLEEVFTDNMFKFVLKDDLFPNLKSQYAKVKTILSAEKASIEDLDWAIGWLEESADSLQNQIDYEANMSADNIGYKEEKDFKDKIDRIKVLMKAAGYLTFKNENN